MELVADYYEKFMKIKGVEIIYGKPPENALRNPAEELFDRFMSHTVHIYPTTEYSKEQILTWLLIICNHPNLLMRYLKTAWNMQ